MDIFALTFQGRPKAKLCALLLSSTLLIGTASPLRAETAANVNLGGTQHNRVAPRAGALNIGGQRFNILPGQLVTDAELAALNQVSKSGQQHLLLGAQGNAVGGHVNLGADLHGTINNLTIPEGVTAVSNFAAGGSFNVLGALNNAGTLYAFSSVPGVHQASFNANSLTNQASGLISSVMPSVYGYSSAVKVLDLHLGATGDLLNLGKIFSSGNLSIAASNVSNSGTIESATGNINFISPGNSPLVVNNLGGSITASQGVINFRDANFVWKNDLSLLGGNVHANAINFFSGDGSVNIDVAQIMGRVNIAAGIAHVSSASPTLDLGNIVLSGDPTFYNTGGDVVLNGTIITGGAAIAIVAGGDILSGSGSSTISTASNTATAGGITLVAGAQFSSSAGANTSTLPPAAGDTTSIITITGGSVIGGRIDLTQGTATTTIDASSGNGNAGDITLVAFAGTSTGSGVILLPSGGTINSNAVNGNAGDVAVYAGGTASGNSIQLGTITASPSISGNPASVVIATATPVVPSSVTILDGMITGGSFSFATTQTGSISTGSITAGGGLVQVQSGRNLSVPSINVTPNLGSGNGGSIVAFSKSSSVLNVGQAGTNSVGSITGTNALVSGAGGGLAFINQGSGGVLINNSGGLAPLTANAAGTGSGGQVFVDSTFSGGTGNVNVLNPVVQAQGVNGNGGSITINSTNAISNNGFLQADVSVTAGTGSGGSVTFGALGVNGDVNSSSAGQNQVGAIVTGGPAGGDSGSLSMKAGRDVNFNPAAAVVKLASVSGNGASLQLSAGRNVNISTTALAANGTGNGAGGSIDMTAGTSIKLSSAIQANGAGSGSGGSITMTAPTISNSSSTSANGGAGGNGGIISFQTNSPSAFQLSISGTPANGVLGQVSATGQSAGTINISNSGSGGVSVANAPLINLAAINGNGGTLLLDGISNGGSGSVFLGSNLGPASINVGGSGAGSGGSITIKGSTVIVPSTSSILAANGGPTGNGGSVTIEASDSSANVVLANLNGGLRILAQGGATSGNGGTININAGKSIFALSSTAAFNAQPQTNGSGGKYFFNAGSNVQISGNWSASALVSGNGGTISITSNSADPLVIDNSGGAPLTQNYMTGSLTANAVANGNGGTISVVNNGTGGVSHNINAALISNTAAGNGNGGALTLDAGGGPLSLGNGFNFNVSATGTGTQGGSIALKGSSVNIGAAGTILTATGNQFGAGGKVLVHSANPSNDINVAAGFFTINVAGGTVSGAGGEIDLASGRNLIVNTGSMTFAPTSGSGARLFFEAGNNVSINNGLSANAAVTGSGGTISITSNSAAAFTINSATANSINGNISAQAVVSGSQGTISVINLGSGGITSTNVVLNANGAGAAGTQTGSITLQGASLSSNIVMNINGGTIGDGGTINLISTSPGSDINVSGAGMVPLATAVNGKGGTINISSGRDIIVNAPSLNIATGTGAGGTLDFSADGRIQITGTLMAVGQGANGGKINLKMNSSQPFVVNASTTNGVSGFLQTNVVGAGNGGSISIVNLGSGGIANQINSSAINVSPGSSGNAGNITLDAAKSGGAGPLYLGNSSAIMFLSANSTVGDGGNIDISGTDIIGGLQSLNLSASSTVSRGGTITILATGANSDVKLGGAASTSASINGVTGAGELTVTAGRDIILASTGNFFGTTSGSGAKLNLIAGTQTVGNVQIFGDLFLEPTLNNGNGGELNITFNDPNSTVNLGTIGSGTCVGGAVIVTGIGTGSPGSMSITNLAAGAPLNIQVGPLGGVSTGSGGLPGSMNLTASNGPVTVTTAAQLAAAINVSGATSFTMSGTSGGLGFIFDNVQVSGPINVTNNINAGSSITLQEGGTFTSSGSSIQLTTQVLSNNMTIASGGGDITIFPRFLINNGIVNAGGGTINVAPIGPMFVQGLGAWITTGKSITLNAVFNPLTIQGSQTYSAAGSPFVFLSGTTIALSAGVSQSVLTNTIYDVGYQSSAVAFSIQMGATSRFNGVGLTSASMFLYAANGTQPMTLKVADNSFATLSTSGGPIVVHAVGNNNTLTLDSIAGTGAATLNVLGGATLFESPNSVTITSNLLISGDKSITINSPSLINDTKILTTFNTGNSLVVTNNSAGGSLTLSGSGAFVQLNAVPGVTVFNSPNLLTLNKADFQVAGTNAKLQINAPELAVSSDSSLDVSGDITFSATGTKTLPLPVLQDLTLVSSGGGNLNLGITLNADQINASTSGTGNISGAGTLVAATSIQLGAGSGSINVKTNTPSLASSSTGDLSVNELDALDLTSILAKNVSITSGGALSNSGNFKSASLSSTSTSFSNSGALAVTGALTVSGGGAFLNSATGVVNAGNTIIAASSFDNDGTFLSTGSVTINATATASNTGTVSGDGLTFNVPILSSSGSLDSLTGVLSITGGTSVTNFGDVVAGGGLSITGNGAFQNTATGTINAGSTSILAGSFINDGFLHSTNNLLLSSSAPAVNTGTISADGPTLSMTLPKLGNSGTISAGGTLSVQSIGSGLEIALDGNMDAALSLNFTAESKSLVFSGSQTFTGIVNLNAIKFGQSVVVQAGQIVQGNTDVYVKAPTLTLQGTLIGNPLHFNTVFGAGTIANDQGDLILPGKLTFSGQNLAILASGNVIAPTGLTAIKLSSATAAGGSLTFVAGYDFTPAPAPPAPGQSFQTFTLGSPSVSGGSVIMPKTAVDTSSKTPGKDAGNITIIAHSGILNAGVISVGALNSSSAKGVGGNVLLIGAGGVQVNGSITSTGITAGSVTVEGAQASIVGGPLTIVNGLQVGSGMFQAQATTSGAGAALFVSGGITATGFAGRGGNINMLSDAQIETGKGIVSSGLKSSVPGLAAGGSVNIFSESYVSVGTGSINSSALVATSAIAAGDGGDISITAFSGVSVNGNLNSAGASNKGAGNGGAGGDITIITSSNNPNNYFIGTVKVTGIVNSSGGSALAGGNGGAGGDVFTESGVLQVLGTSNKNSVIASAGSGGVPGAAGSVQLLTYATQPIPSNFDMLSTTKSVVALPGGMFTVGTAKPVNGTAGNIVSGPDLADKNNAARIVDTNDFISPNVNIVVTGGPVTISTGNIDPDNGLGVRTLVTPAQAVAALQVARGDAQAINLNTAGQALTGSVMSFDQTEIPLAFSAFKLQAADAPNNAIQFQVFGLRPVVTLGKAALIAGEISFPTAGATSFLDFGAGAVNVSSGGHIDTDSTGTLILAGKNPAWINNGLIEAGTIALSTSGKTLSITEGATGKIQGVTGAVNPSIILSPELMPAFALKVVVNGGSFDLPVEFGNTHAVAQYKTTALSNALGFNSLRTVALSFAMTDSINNPIPATVGGNLAKASSLSILTLPNKVGSITTLTPLVIEDNSQFSVQTKSLISSVNGINIGNNVKFSAGVLKSTAAPSGILAGSDVIKAGSLTILNTGAAGITIGNGGSMIVNGGNLSITATGGSIGVGSSGTYQANGGRITVLASGTVSGASSNTFYARAASTGSGAQGGGIEVGSGLAKSTFLTTAFTKAKNTNPFTGALGAGVTINNNGGVLMANLASGGIVNLKTGVTPSTVTLNKGAIVFDALGFGSSVQFDNSTFKVDALKPIANVERWSSEDEIIVDTGEEDSGNNDYLVELP